MPTRRDRLFPNASRAMDTVAPEALMSDPELDRRVTSKMGPSEFSKAQEAYLRDGVGTAGTKSRFADYQKRRQNMEGAVLQQARHDLVRDARIAGELASLESKTTPEEAPAVLPDIPAMPTRRTIQPTRLRDRGDITREQQEEWKAATPAGQEYKGFVGKGENVRAVYGKPTAAIEEERVATLMEDRNQALSERGAMEEGQFAKKHPWAVEKKFKSGAVYRGTSKGSGQWSEPKPAEDVTQGPQGPVVKHKSGMVGVWDPKKKSYEWKYPPRGGDKFSYNPDTKEFSTQGGGVQIDMQHLPEYGNEAETYVKIKSPDGDIRRVPKERAQFYVKKGGAIVE